LLARQTGAPGEGVNSSCNLDNVASATAAPRSRTPRFHRQPKFASSVTRLGESAAIGHSPRGVFFDGTVLFPAGVSAHDVGPSLGIEQSPAVAQPERGYMHIRSQQYSPDGLNQHRKASHGRSNLIPICAPPT
jgi:hypothetical protein